jgi:CheY-like chemotaxis protein
MLCVLLAEPDTQTRNFMAMKLEEAGYEVDTARNGQEAIILLSSGRHDLIISDLDMIGKSGLDFLREIRRHPDYMTIPFVLFTRADPRLKTDNNIYRSLIDEIEDLGAVYLPKTPDNFRRFPPSVSPNSDLAPDR